MAKNYYLKIINYAKKEKIPVLGKLPYKKDFVDSTINMKPVVEFNPEYKKVFQEIIKKVYETAKNDYPEMKRGQGNE